MTRRFVVGLGVLSLVAAACSSSTSAPTVPRPVAKPGEIVTVMGSSNPRSDPLALVYLYLAIDGKGQLSAAGNGKVVRVGTDRKARHIVDCHTPFPTKGVRQEANACDEDNRVGALGGIAADAGGTVYIADAGTHRIRAVTPSGRVDLAGTGRQGHDGPLSGRASDADLAGLEAIAVDGAGNVYFTNGQWTIVKLDKSGTLTTIAGTAQRGFSGDGGPATSAQLTQVTALATDRAGNLFVLDEERVRRIDTHGVITTIAGTGAVDFSGDGGPATQATFNHPEALTVDPAGDIFVSDSFNYRVRKIAPNGIITTVAGTGIASTVSDKWISGVQNDHVPALLATFNRPRGLALDSEGNLYIADQDNTRVRMVGAVGSH